MDDRHDRSGRPDLSGWSDERGGADGPGGPTGSAGQPGQDPYAPYGPYGTAASADTDAAPAPASYDYGSYAQGGPYGQQQPAAYGYDAYGQPVQPGPAGYPPQAGQEPYGSYASYGQQRTPEGYGYDPYPAGPPSPAAYGPGGRPRDGGAAGQPEEVREPEAAPTRPADGEARRAGDGPRAEAPVYRTEQFAFVEEPDGAADDVIDWLKFTETRAERRDERRRQARLRVIAAVVAAVLAVLGGLAYLWHAGSLPGQSGSGGAVAASGPQKRDVIVVHLRQTKGDGSATALLVDNETADKATAVLLPNTLALPTDDGSPTTLGASVVDAGSDATRDALGTLLGADIQGTWRLDTPYLENLVQLVGGISVDTDATVPGPDRGADPVVRRGADQALTGQAAVAYATYRARGEAQTRQLARFGQVLRGVLDKLSSDASSATATVESLAQIPDPSLSERQLGAFLARLAGRARSGAYATTALPVQPDGTLGEQATRAVVRDVLGGAVKKGGTGQDAPPRVSVKNAGGGRGAADTARIALVNGGFTVVGSTENGGPARAASQVAYGDPAQAGQAREVAATLGLPASAVRRGTVAANADITVLLGRDYPGKN
ncbi:LytR C-terminal domain-containing protein [Streptomyces sp. B1866]|uniref:LCP family protein n=1 Tax=Streptomyces sp. B1866 TaxID=3075431 RepID=UPI002890A0F0|nr:LytR C-terminal domain-containing protein [Streptomyces sp. B1866]MDT3396994.1 LytR C-terminal domain-containing protein [Streptomyces sp. B1866]